MKRLFSLFIISLLALSIRAQGLILNPYVHAGSGFTIHTFTVATSLSASDLTNYTFTFEFTLADAKSVANGGLITDAQHDDLVFSSSADGSSPVAYKIQNWDATTGHGIGYVKGNFSAATGFTCYLKTGDASITTDQSTGNPFDANTKAYWDMGDASSLNLTDLTTNALTWTATSSPAAVAGKLGGAVNFSPAGSRLTVASSVLDLTTWTITIWNYSITNAGNLTDRRDSNPTWYWFYSTGFGWFVYGLHNGSGFSDHTYSTSAPTIGVWYMYTYVMDNANDIVRLYINGAEVDNESETGDPVISGAEIMYLGTNAGLGDKWDANVDEVRVDGSARTADWILATYRLMNAPGTYITIT